MTDEAVFRRTNPAGAMKIVVTRDNEDVYEVWTTGFSVRKTSQNEYEVRL